MYPFGLKHKGYNNVTSANVNSIASKFKYNGKEQENSFGYNMYEMDVRSYDPAIARWTAIDPVTHHSLSTYNAFDNNPVFYADPSGADSATSGLSNNHHLGRLGNDYGMIMSFGRTNGEAQNKEAKNGGKNSSETENSTQNEHHPQKIDLSKQTPEQVLETIIEWAIYLRKKSNDEIIYFSDIVSSKTTKVTTVNKLFDAAGGSSKANDFVILSDKNGNTLKLGIDTDFFKRKDGPYTEIDKPWFFGQLGKSNKYHIRFPTNPQYGSQSSNPPVLIRLHFTGKEFYNNVKNRILNPVAPAILYDGEMKSIKIPIINKQ